MNVKLVLLKQSHYLQLRYQLMIRFKVFLIALTFATPALADELSYSYSRLGNTVDSVNSTTPGTVLMGGGRDVDAALKWMCKLSGNGDFLVLRATGTDAYNSYIKDMCPNENSVSTLIIPSRTAASYASVADTINKAEAIWIAGGDQSNYINFWKGTPVQAALNDLIAKGVPIGGTSAGLSVLTQFVYTAQQSKGVTSSQALTDPFNRHMTFDHDFVNIPFLEGVIGDPHLFIRDRMGRDFTFLCRIYENGWSKEPRGISIDARTALMIDSKGHSKVVGDGAVYFLQAPGAPQACSSETPLTYQDISVYRIRQGAGTVDLNNWQGSGGDGYSVSIMEGALISKPTDDDGYPY